MFPNSQFLTWPQFYSVQVNQTGTYTAKKDTKSHQRSLLRLQRHIRAVLSVRAAGAPRARLRAGRLENHERQASLQFEVKWQLQVVPQLKGLDDVKVPQHHLAEQEQNEDGGRRKDKTHPQTFLPVCTSVSGSSPCRSPAEAKNSKTRSSSSICTPSLQRQEATMSDCIAPPFAEFPENPH